MSRGAPCQLCSPRKFCPFVSYDRGLGVWPLPSLKRCPLPRETRGDFVMPSRRAVIIGALAASATLRTIAQAQNPPAGGDAAPRTILRLQRRDIEVNGKPASVNGIQQLDGTFGITTQVGKPFRVQVENRIDQPSLIHWHGLAPPWQQDGVPGVSGPPIPAAGSADYDFPLNYG